MSETRRVYMTKISKAIHLAATNSSMTHLSCVEYQIIEAFCGFNEYWVTNGTSNRYNRNRKRVFMLFVAEALNQ